MVQIKSLSVFITWNYVYPKTVIRKPKTPTEYNWEGYDVGY